MDAWTEVFKCCSSLLQCSPSEEDSDDKKESKFLVPSKKRSNGTTKIRRVEEGQTFPKKKKSINPGQFKKGRKSKKRGETIFLYCCVFNSMMFELAISLNRKQLDTFAQPAQ